MSDQFAQIASETEQIRAHDIQFVGIVSATELITEFTINGLCRIRARQWPGWSRAIEETEAHGYQRMAALIRQVHVSERNVAAAHSILKLLTIERDVSA